MMSVSGRGFAAASSIRVAVIGAACAFVVVAGCQSKTSNEERIKQAREATGLSSVRVYPFAGRVTVDSQPPKLKSKRNVLVVMAYDTSRPSATTADQAFVTARDDGSFEFSDGGLPPGKYVMLFAALDRKAKNARAGDALQNLHNDPEVNAKKPEFTIDHQEPGKTDYFFNLNVVGETPPAHAGPKAFTRFPK
jgi:hypothetical protein